MAKLNKMIKNNFQIKISKKLIVNYIILDWYLL